MHHLGYTRLGDPQGKPLVLIHGWGCDSSFLYPLAQMFEHRDVYLIDLPGYGKSKHLAPIADDFASSIYFLINTIPDGADVMSWSFGSIYAIRALSIINNPCYNFAALGQTTLSSPNVLACLNQAKADHLLDLEEEKDLNTILAMNNSAPPLSTTISFAHEQEQAQEQAQEQKQENALKQNVIIKQEINSQTKASLLQTILCKDHLPKINSFITICGSPRFPSDPNWPGISPIRIFKCNTALNERRLKMILSVFYHMQITNNSEKESSHIKKLLENPPHVDYEVLMAGIRLVTYIDERQALKHLDIPSLHLFGAQDKLVPCSIAHFFQTSPLHQSYIFPYSAHNPYLSEPQLFKEVVNNFFEQVRTLNQSSAENIQIKKVDIAR